MRRIATLSVVAFLMTAAPAWAVTNTLTYHVGIDTTEDPAPNKPAPLSFGWMHHLGTSPDGQQPDAVSHFKVFFAKQIGSNAQYFPSCSHSEIDGQANIPASCQPAVVGGGTVTAFAGTPGFPLSNSVREDMDATLLNGSPAGQQWLLYLRSADSAPVVIRRALAGTVVAASDPYGFAVDFAIPSDLQSQLGLTISLTDMNLGISSAPHAVQVDGSYYRASFLTLSSCETAVPSQENVELAANGYPIGTLTDAESDGCDGAFGYPTYPPPSYPTYPYYPTYPNYPLLPGQDGNPGGTGGGGGGGGGGDTGGGGSGGGGGTGGGGDTGGGSTDTTTPTGTTSSTSGGTTSGSGGNPPPPTPPRITGASVLKPVTVGGNGSFTLPGITVACPAGAGGNCTVSGDAIGGGGAAKVAVLAKVAFKLQAGKSSAVKMKLTKAGKRLLARKKLLKLTVRLRVREANGVQTKRTLKARIKARRRP
jgi:hypothetical protein